MTITKKTRAFHIPERNSPQVPPRDFVDKKNSLQRLVHDGPSIQPDFRDISSTEAIFIDRRKCEVARSHNRTFSVIAGNDATGSRERRKTTKKDEALLPASTL